MISRSKAFCLLMVLAAASSLHAGALDAPTVRQIDTWAVHTITLNWSAVPGASSYRVEHRNAKGEWLEVAKTNDCAFVDNEVISGTKYAYRVQAIAQDQTSLTKDFEASTARFRIYDSTDFWSRLPVPGAMPGMESLGAGGGALFAPTDSDRRGPASELATKKLTRRVVDARVSLFIDIESWAFGVRPGDPAHALDVATQSVEKMKQVIRWIREAAIDRGEGGANLQLGIYGVVSIAPANPNSAQQMKEWREASHIAPLKDLFSYQPVIDGKTYRGIDFICPSHYATFENPTIWAQRMRMTVDMIHEEFHKPAIPFVRMDFDPGPHSPPGDLPIDFWRVQLAALGAHADGLAIFAAGRKWEPKAPWWLDMQRFIETQKSTSPPAPAAPSIDSISSDRLAWIDTSMDTSGKIVAFVIERSTDGKVFARVGYVGSGERTFSDFSATSGTKYIYRIGALDARGQVAYSESREAVATRNAVAIQRADYADHFPGYGPLNDFLYIGGPGSKAWPAWVQFDKMNFGDEGATKILIDAGFDGADVEVWKDGLKIDGELVSGSRDAKLLGTVHLDATAGKGKCVAHSGEIEKITGEASIYLLFKNTQYLHLDWIKFEK